MGDVPQQMAGGELGHWVWLTQLLLIPIVGILIRFWWQQRQMAVQVENVCDCVRKLVEMHKHPDDYNFGSTMTNAGIRHLKDSVDKQSEVLDRLDRTMEKNDATTDRLIRVVEKLDDRLRSIQINDK